MDCIFLDPITPTYARYASQEVVGIAYCQCIHVYPFVAFGSYASDIVSARSTAHLVISQRHFQGARKHLPAPVINHV